MATMATKRGSRRWVGALMIISSSFLFHQEVNGFFPSPCQSVSSRTTTVARATNNGQVEDASSPCHLSRRSAIAIGATAALAPLSIPLHPANAISSGSIPYLPLLKGGVDFPMLALNTAGMSMADTYRAIEFAREEGMTHIDFHPGQERDGVAEYLSKHKDERDLLFLNTKIRKAPPGTSPKDAANLARDQIDEDLRILNVKNVDMLMLRDSPDPKVIQSQWAVIEEALAEGKTRSVGVVNFCPSALKSVLQTAKVFPAVNYIMVHVGMGEDVHGLRGAGENVAGIRTFTYGQTGEPNPNMEIVNNPILQRIGKGHGKSTEEVALRWVLQNGMAASIRPSSSFGKCVGEECRLGIAKQASCFDWALTEREMEKLDAMESPDDNPTLFSSAGCPGAFGT
mmetsp:Transcript_16548/g.34817  ORF Transcript_16548/g.34817 Transcript_16548/m.34817 type:complete len:398 (-) Transcript_16548:171-1364(-)